MDARQNRRREVAELAGPRMPADRGLASLGLLMQLGGSLFGGYMALVALLTIFGGPGHGALTMFLFGTAGAIRSGFHRAAGAALLYGSPTGAFRPTYRYAGVAAAQTAFTLLLLAQDGGVPASTNVAVALVLLAWPAALVALLGRERLRGLGREEVLPVGEDFGFEGAAVFMVLLGLLGGLAALFALFLSFQAPHSALGAANLLVIGALAMLLVRSVLHTAAGAVGARGADSDDATEAAQRYFSFGVVSSVIVGGVIVLRLLAIPGVGLDPVVFLVAVAAALLLLAWPLILRRFYTERNFAALLAGAQGPNAQRAPDAGMTAIGWLLVAMGSLQLGLVLPDAIAGENQAWFVLRFFDVLNMGLGAEDAVSYSTRWSVGIGLLQLWAGLELVHMTDRHRVAATVYGVVASLAAITFLWPRVSQIELALAGGQDPLRAGVDAFRLAVALVVPVATLVLVHRRRLPSARARVRV